MTFSVSFRFVLLFLLLLSFEGVLLAPNMFSSFRPQSQFFILNKMAHPFGGNGNAIGSASLGDGTSAEPFLTTDGEGKAVAKRRTRMDSALLATILTKRRESGPNDAFRVRLRSLDQMGNTNCYFSPVQCYFFEERKRRSAPMSGQEEGEAANGEK